jgi:hypothetical protein
MPIRRRAAGTWLPVLLVALTVAGCDRGSWSFGTASQPTSARVTSAPVRDTPATFGLIPPDAMLTLFARPLPKDLNPDVGGQYGPREDPSAINTALQMLVQVFANKMKPGDIIGLRIGEAFLEAINYPYAIILYDCHAEPLPGRPNVMKIDKLQMAAVIDTQGRSERFYEMLARTFGAVTSTATAEITHQEAYGFKYSRLYDNRLDPDEVLEWGNVQSHFVISFGEGVFQRIAAAAAGAKPSADRNEWIREVRAARAADSYVELFVNPKRIRSSLDPFVQGAASQFFIAWDAEELDRSHWAFGLQDRGMFCVAHHVLSGETVERTYAQPEPRDSPDMAVVPPETHYAVWRTPVGPFLNRFISSLVATRDPHTQERIRNEWTRIQREFGFDAQREVLDNLGDTIVQHKFPMHPLKIPVCVTTLIEIKQNPETVAKAIETMCTAWQSGISDAINKGIVMPATLTRDDDGIWFLNFGLAGPAWIVTDKYIVGSWSPAALRTYLSTVGDAAGKVIPVVLEE